MADEKNESMTSLKDILQGVLSGANRRFNTATSEIWEVWDEVVGPAISDHASPKKIIKNKLIVHVSESVWLQELEYVSETIKDKLNQRLGRKAVDKIVFRPGSL